MPASSIDILIVPPALETEVAAAVAERLSARIREGLAEEGWTPARALAEAAWAERRLTAAQRAAVWMALVADVELAELMG